MKKINYSALALSLGLIAFNFLAYYLVSPYLYVNPDSDMVREFSWASANASTLIITPVILILGVIYPGILRATEESDG